KTGRHPARMGGRAARMGRQTLPPPSCSWRRRGRCAGPARGRSRGNGALTPPPARRTTPCRKPTRGTPSRRPRHPPPAGGTPACAAPALDAVVGRDRGRDPVVLRLQLPEPLALGRLGLLLPHALAEVRDLGGLLVGELVARGREAEVGPG